MLQIGNRPSAAFPSIFLSFQYLIEPHSRHAKLEGLPVLGHFPHLEDRERVANIAQAFHAEV
jgi:pimeloyl-ACP methyl ester carboxylesterase